MPGAAGALEALAARYRLVAVLSGRRAGDVKALIPAEGVRYLGIYGAEELGADRPAPPPAGREPGVIAALAAEAQAFVAAEHLAGVLIEDKGDSLALHYRLADSPSAGAALARWADARAGAAGLTVRPGKMVVELIPPGPTKADAVETLITRHGLRRCLVAGDDVADVAALRRAGELLGPGALRVGVASAEEPAGLAEVADLMVPGPPAVVELLEAFLQ